MSAEAVARIGYQGYCRGRTVVATGLMNKLSMMCTRLLPNAVLNPVISRLHKPVQAQGGFTQTSAAREKTDR